MYMFTYIFLFIIQLHDSSIFFSVLCEMLIFSLYNGNLTKYIITNLVNDTYNDFNHNMPLYSDIIIQKKSIMYIVNYQCGLM